MTTFALSHPAVHDLCVRCLPAPRRVMVSHKSRGQALKDFLTREIAAGEAGEIPQGYPKWAESSHGCLRDFGGVARERGRRGEKTPNTSPASHGRKEEKTPGVNHPAPTSQSHQSISRRLPRRLPPAERSPSAVLAVQLQGFVGKELQGWANTFVGLPASQQQVRGHSHGD